MDKKKHVFRRVIFFFIFLVSVGGCSWPPTPNVYRPAVWLIDFKQAQAKAREINFPILAAFVSLDWCPWCQKMEEEIFSQQEFLTYAENHFVLFQADYPKHQEQPAKIKDQNKALAVTYSIDSYPTVLILDRKGKKIAETGYRRGRVRAYLDHLEKLLRKK